MNGKKIFFLISVIMLGVLPVVFAESTRLGIISQVHPKLVIEKLQAQPSILYFAAGKLYFNSGNYDKALEMFTRASEIRPDFAPAYHNIGVIYYEQGNKEDAIANLEKSVEVDPEYSRGYYSLGIMYFQNQEYDRAIEYLSDAVKLKPGDANINFDLGQSYVASFRRDEESNAQDYDDLAKALEYLKKAEEIEPGFAYAVNNMEIIESIVNAREELIS